jgi:hypothetical protein
MSEYAILKYRGHIYRVQKQPFESQEQVMDRAWYIAKNINSEKSNYEQVYFQSLEWVYEKYLKVKYL